MNRIGVRVIPNFEDLDSHEQPKQSGRNPNQQISNWELAFQRFHPQIDKRKPQK